MSRTITQTIEHLRRLEAPELLIHVAEGGSAPGKLRWQIQTPKTFYDLIDEFPGNMPYENKLIPLWENNGDNITAYVDADSPFVIRYYYEDPEDSFETIGTTINDAIQRLLTWLLVETGAEPDDIQAAAEACGIADPSRFVQRVQDEADP